MTHVWINIFLFYIFSTWHSFLFIKITLFLILRARGISTYFFNFIINKMKNLILSLASKNDIFIIKKLINLLKYFPFFISIFLNRSSIMVFHHRIDFLDFFCLFVGYIFVHLILINFIYFNQICYIINKKLHINKQILSKINFLIHLYYVMYTRFIWIL